MYSSNSKALRWLFLFWLLARGTPASAQTDEIQVYDGELAAPGQFSMTLHNNFTPKGRREADFPGGVIAEHSLNGVPEFAYGVTDWFEAGAYLPVYTRTADGHFLFDSAKLRALFAVPHAAERKWFYGVNFELSYNTPHWETSRYSAEMRPIFGVHLGKVTLIVNPILDWSFDGLANLEFSPAVRAAYTVNERWTVSLEHYADYGPIRHLQASKDLAQTAFAVVNYSRGGGGVEFGIGHGLNRASDALVFKLMLNHDL
jgi:hypothetical protein